MKSERVSLSYRPYSCPSQVIFGSIPASQEFYWRGQPNNIYTHFHPPRRHPRNTRGTIPWRTGITFRIRPVEGWTLSLFVISCIDILLTQRKYTFTILKVIVNNRKAYVQQVDKRILSVNFKLVLSITWKIQYSCKYLTSGAGNHFRSDSFSEVSDVRQDGF